MTEGLRTRTAQNLARRVRAVVEGANHTRIWQCLRSATANERLVLGVKMAGAHYDSLKMQVMRSPGMFRVVLPWGDSYHEYLGDQIISFYQNGWDQNAHRVFHFHSAQLFYERDFGGMVRVPDEEPKTKEQKSLGRRVTRKIILGNSPTVGHALKKGARRGLGRW